jgi:hypothetical protein
MSKMRPRPLPRRTADLVSSSLEIGGASRDRTDDLKLAKLALSQLSYGPIELGVPPLRPLCELRGAAVVGREGVEPSTSRLSGVRSNHLSYRPPCLAGHKAAGGVSQLRLHFPNGKRFQDEGT